jgi:hypothetical protein
MTHLKTVIKGLLAYIAIAGIVTMSLFMMEEAYQTAMFGTWPAQDAKDWALVKQGADLMSATSDTLILLNNCVGWVQPLAFIAYRSYGQSAQFYVEALRSKVFAHAPELFVGEEVSVTISPSSMTQNDAGWATQLGRVTVILPAPSLVDQRITGTLIRKDSDLILKAN